VLGILYLFLSSFVGFHLIRRLLPRIFFYINNKSLIGETVCLKEWMISIPAGFLTGTLLLTWLTYLLGYGFAKTENPLLFANLISMLLFGIIAFLVIKQNPMPYKQLFINFKHFSFKDKERKARWDFIFVILVSVISLFLTYFTLHLDKDNLMVGGWVYGDFGPHLSMIRSFSWGNNFPTEYSLFANGHIYYHFLFYFLSGNLEFLGLKLDDAFNIPSALSLIAFWMLMYAFIIIITGKQVIGYITFILFHLRSSFSFFTFLHDTLQVYSNLTVKGNVVLYVLSEIVSIQRWIGHTPFEVWGMWTMPNIVMNQRHNAIVYGFLILGLIYVLPLFHQMMDSLGKRECENWKSFMKRWVQEAFLMKESWLPQSGGQALFLGLLIGLITFWNGAIVLCLLMILFFLALFSKHRLEYLMIASLAIALIFLEKHFFEGGAGSAFKPEFYTGFVSHGEDIKGLFRYYVEALGLLPIVVLLAIVFIPTRAKWLAFTFCVPFFAANLVKFTLDIMNNHKFIHVSIIFIDIIVAYFIYQLFASKNRVLKTTAISLFIMLTVSGIVDIFSFINVNKKYITYNLKDPLIFWVKENTPANSIFLTNIDICNPVTLAGRKLFLGWSYGPWSIGYNAGEREKARNEIYEGNDVEKTQYLLGEYHINYVLIDQGLRMANWVKVNESLFKNHFPEVYHDSSNTVIYKINDYTQSPS
jgi:hypothetical protein